MGLMKKCYTYDYIWLIADPLNKVTITTNTTD